MWCCIHADAEAPRVSCCGKKGNVRCAVVTVSRIDPYPHYEQVTIVTNVV